MLIESTTLQLHLLGKHWQSSVLDDQSSFTKKLTLILSAKGWGFSVVRKQGERILLGVELVKENKRKYMKRKYLHTKKFFPRKRSGSLGTLNIEWYTKELVFFEKLPSLRQDFSTNAAAFGGAPPPPPSGFGGGPPPGINEISWALAKRLYQEFQKRAAINSRNAANALKLVAEAGKQTVVSKARDPRWVAGSATSGLFGGYAGRWWNLEQNSVRFNRIADLTGSHGERARSLGQRILSIDHKSPTAQVQEILAELESLTANEHAIEDLGSDYNNPDPLTNVLQRLLLIPHRRGGGYTALPPIPHVSSVALSHLFITQYQLLLHLSGRSRGISRGTEPLPEWTNLFQEISQRMVVLPQKEIQVGSISRYINPEIIRRIIVIIVGLLAAQSGGGITKSYFVFLDTNTYFIWFKDKWFIFYSHVVHWVGENPFLQEVISYAALFLRVCSLMVSVIYPIFVKGYKYYVIVLVLTTIFPQIPGGKWVQSKASQLAELFFCGCVDLVSKLFEPFLYPLVIVWTLGQFMLKGLIWFFLFIAAKPKSKLQSFVPKPNKDGGQHKPPLALPEFATLEATTVDASSWREKDVPENNQVTQNADVPSLRKEVVQEISKEGNLIAVLVLATLGAMVTFYLVDKK